jgi:hypothetical protein
MYCWTADCLDTAVVQTSVPTGHDETKHHNMTFKTYQHKNVSTVFLYVVAPVHGLPFIVTWNVADYCIASLYLPRYSMTATVFTFLIHNTKYYGVGTAIGASEWMLWFVWKQKMARKVFIHYLTSLSVPKTVALFCTTVNSELEIVWKQAVVVQCEVLSQLFVVELMKTMMFVGVATVWAQT